MPLTIAIFSAKWSDSATVLAVFALSGVPVSLSYVHNAALKATGITRSFFLTQAAMVIVYIPLLLAFVNGGIEHSAVAYLIACSAVVPFEVWLLRTALSIRVGSYARALLGPSLATAVMAGAMLVVVWQTATWPPVLRVGAETLPGILAYVIGLRILAPRSYATCRDVVARFLNKRAPVLS